MTDRKIKKGVFIGLRFKSLLMILLVISTLMLAVIGILESYIRKTLIAEAIEKGEVSLKGKTVPVKVYEIHGIKDA